MLIELVLKRSYVNRICVKKKLCEGEVMLIELMLRRSYVNRTCVKEKLC